MIKARVFARLLHTSAVLRADEHKPLPKKLLVANRGEIACRVFRTAKRLGIKTVAVYSEADRFVKHVAMADEAVCIGPAPTNKSYLVVDNVLKAIRDTGADCVHPGYGFLSENSKFSQTLEDNGIIFLGPTAYAMDALGDKIHSKKLAKEHGVNTIPGYIGEVEKPEDVLRVAHEIGYPVMVKASAGGGGKGMRVCYNDKELLENFKLSKSEALSSFGDDRMLIEKFIENPRHIEIQMLCDGQGTSLYFPERDCSVQRRNQKVLEESPSTFIDQKTREAMGAQAVMLANAVGYRSAGTIEFVCDQNRNFYFLEMNTRLQVEHPISEMVTGVDIVEHMIYVGAGRRLTLKQSDLSIKGHALESRVYAEDPLRNFMPSIGTLTRYVEPLQVPEDLGTVRIDSGILEGSEISIYYDPLISKLITHGKDRKQALATMVWALDNYIIRGVTNNVNLLRDLCVHESFVAGDITTKFLPTHYPNGYKGHALNDVERDELTVCAAALHYRLLMRERSVSGQLPSSQETFDAQLPSFVITINDANTPDKNNPKSVSIGIDADDDYQSIIVALSPEKQFEVRLNSLISSPLVEVEFDDLNAQNEQFNNTRTLQIMESTDTGYRLQFLGTIFDVKVETSAEHKLASIMPVKKARDVSNMLVCPMPGTVVDFLVKEGDVVPPGGLLCILEAMKMQNALHAEDAVKVKKIHARKGATVQIDEILIEFEKVK